MRDVRPPSEEVADQWQLVHGRLEPGASIQLTIRSGSMLPLLPVGARIEVVSAIGETLQVGDVVVFRQGDRLIVHRLLFGWGAGPGAWFLQRGDGISPTGFLSPRAILGRVQAVHLADGSVITLVGATAEWRARRQARRSLARFMHSVFLAPARKAKQWLLRQNTGSV